jgi:cysteine desulfurase
MSFCAHKTYGPKGIGALYVRRKPRVRLEAQMHGGGHERGMRSGTLATHQIVGMGEAFRIAREEMGTENERIRMLRDAAQGPDGHRGSSSTATSSARAAQPQRQLQLRRRRVADHGDQGHRGVVGLGLHLGQPGAQSTCCARWAAATNWRTARSASPSAASPRRRRSTTPCQAAARQVGKLRELSPLWEMYKDGVDLNSPSSGLRT